MLSSPFSIPNTLWTNLVLAFAILAPGERVCFRHVYGVDSVLVNLPGGNPGLWHL